MTRVLLVGLDPVTVDFSDPALPPGLDAQKIEGGIQAALGQMRQRGWTADHRYITPTDIQPLIDQLGAATYDCVVIGGGVRVPPRNLALFEQVVNAVRRGAPGAAIAFNSTPLDSAEAVERTLGRD